MNKREVLAALIDKKKAGILHILLNATEEMYLKEIAEKSDVSIASTFRILQEFVGLKIIQKKEWKNSKVYFCEKNHLNFLKDLFLEPFDGVTEFVAAVKDIRGVKSIILHGAQQKGKANVLIIGENIDTVPIEDICLKLKNKSFELSYLTLGRNQYDQMIKMGLYGGEKKVLL